jgi:hypothetical protein
VGAQYRELGDVKELLQLCCCCCCCCSFVAALAEVSGASGSKVYVHALLEREATSTKRLLDEQTVHPLVHFLLLLLVPCIPCLRIRTSR